MQHRESRSIRTLVGWSRGSGSSVLKESIEILHRLSHGLFNGSFDKRPIEETCNTRSRLVFDDQTVYAAFARGFEVAFMANVG